MHNKYYNQERDLINDVPGPGKYDQFQSRTSEKKFRIPIEASEIEKERKANQQSAIEINRRSKNYPGPGTYSAFSEVIFLFSFIQLK